jgi:hypothetical protein
MRLSWAIALGAGSVACVTIPGAHVPPSSDPRGWRPGPVGRQIDEILALMMDEGPGGGHHDDMLDPRWTRLGVGITNPGGEAYVTTDFAP